MDLSGALTPVLEAARNQAREVDATGAFPHAAVGALRDSGLLGLTLPADAGGMGGGPRELVEAISQLATVCGSTAMVYLMHVSATMAVAAAPPAGRPELVGQLAGQRLGTLAFSEAGSRSHFWAPVSQSQTADGGTHVKARKSWVTSAGHADVYVVSTLTSPESVSPGGTGAGRSLRGRRRHAGRGGRRLLPRARAARQRIGADDVRPHYTAR